MVIGHSVNNFCDAKAAEAISAPCQGGGDSFFSDQQIGITWQGARQYGSPRQAILMAKHNNILRDYICEKSGWTTAVFDTANWSGLESYLGSITAVQRTNAIKMTYNWVHDGYQNDLFATYGEVHMFPAKCGRQEAHQHYISCYAPQMTTAKDKCLRDLKNLWKKNTDRCAYKQGTSVYTSMRHV